MPSQLEQGFESEFRESCECSFGVVRVVCGFDVGAFTSTKRKALGGILQDKDVGSIKEHCY